MFSFAATAPVTATYIFENMSLKEAILYASQKLEGKGTIFNCLSRSRPGEQGSFMYNSCTSLSAASTPQPQQGEKRKI